MSTDDTRTGASPPTPPVDLAPARKRVEELILWGSYDRAKQELLKLREGLVADPQSRLELEVIDRRIKEVSELSSMTDTRLREYLERGQFYFNNFEYTTAIRVWRADPEFQGYDEVKSRVAFAQGLAERLEETARRVKMHVDRQEPEAALRELSTVRNLDPKRSRLWNLERNAQNLLNQKRVTALQEQVQNVLKQNDYEGALTLLDWIGELSQHILTVRWLKKTREDIGFKLIPEFHRALQAGERPQAEKVFRCILRLNVEGSFDSQLEELRKLIGPINLPAPPPEAAASAPVDPLALAPLPEKPHAAPHEKPRAFAPASPALPSTPAAPAAAPLRKSIKPLAQSRRVWAYAAAVVLLVVAAHETMCQIRIGAASALCSSGKADEAAKAIEGLRLVIFKREHTESLRKEIAFQTPLLRARRAILQKSWHTAEAEVGTAVEVGEQVKDRDAALRSVLAEWRQAVIVHARNGRINDAASGFAQLVRAEKTAGADCAPARKAEFGLELARLLLPHGAFPQAISAARQAQTTGENTREAADLLEQIRIQMLHAAQGALASDEYEKAQALFRLVVSQYPERPNELERYTKLVNFTRALKAGQRALEKGELPEAESAYQDAMSHSSGDAEARGKLEALRTGIAKSPKRDPRAGSLNSQPQSQADADLDEAYAIASRSNSIMVGRDGDAGPHGLYANFLTGTWTLQPDPAAPEKFLLITGRITLAEGDYVQPVGDLRIGAVITTRRELAVAGQVVKIPLLLPGASQDFEMRLPMVRESRLRVGIKAP